MAEIPRIPADVVERLNAQSEAALKRLDEIINDDKWQDSKKTTEEIQFFYRTMEDSPYGMIKSIVHIPAPMDACTAVLDPITTIDDNTPEAERRSITFRHVVSSNPDEETQPMIFYCACPSPNFMVSPREFYLYRRHYVQGTKHVYLHVTPEGECPGIDDSVRKGYVRGKMNLQGFIAEPEEGGVVLTYFVYFDPCGSIPAMVYNMAVENQGYTAKGTKKRILANLQK